MDRISVHLRYRAASYVVGTLFAVGLLALVCVAAVPAVEHLAHDIQAIQHAVS